MRQVAAGLHREAEAGRRRRRASPARPPAGPAGRRSRRPRRCRRPPRSARASGAGRAPPDTGRRASWRTASRCSRSAPQRASRSARASATSVSRRRWLCSAAAGWNQGRTRRPSASTTRPWASVIVGPGEAPHRVAPEGDDDLGGDHLELGVQPRPVVGDLVGPRVAVARRARLDDVRDEHVAARETRLLQQQLQQLARGADEGAPGRVLACSGRLPDEHDAGVGGALAGDEVGRLLADGEAAWEVPEDLAGDGLQARLRRCGARGRHAALPAGTWPSSSRRRAAATGASSEWFVLSMTRTESARSARALARSPSSRSSSSP